MLTENLQTRPRVELPSDDAKSGTLELAVGCLVVLVGRWALEGKCCRKKPTSQSLFCLSHLHGKNYRACQRYVREKKKLYEFWCNLEVMTSSRELGKVVPHWDTLALRENNVCRNCRMHIPVSGQAWVKSSRTVDQQRERLWPRGRRRSNGDLTNPVAKGLCAVWSIFIGQK